MRAGELRHLIEIFEQDESARNELNELIGPLVLVMRVHAQALPVRGREYLAQDRAQEAVDVKFRLRYVRGITASMLVRWEGRLHEIVSPPIDVGGRHKTLELMCVERRSPSWP